MDSAKPSRPMKYPYTFSAKLAQFPYKYYFEHSWMARYWVYGLIATLPAIYQIHKAVNSPGNVKLWEEKARQEELEHAHH